jgi:hypothetical protein
MGIARASRAMLSNTNGPPLGKNKNWRYSSRRTRSTNSG